MAPPPVHAVTDTTRRLRSSWPKIAVLSPLTCATTLAILAFAPEQLITARAGGIGVNDLPCNITSDTEFDWSQVLADRVPVQRAVANRY